MKVRHPKSAAGTALAQWPRVVFMKGRENPVYFIKLFPIFFINLRLDTLCVPDEITLRWQPSDNPALYNNEKIYKYPRHFRLRKKYLPICLHPFPSVFDIERWQTEIDNELLNYFFSAPNGNYIMAWRITCKFPPWHETQWHHGVFQLSLHCKTRFEKRYKMVMPYFPIFICLFCVGSSIGCLDSWLLW